MKFIVEYFGVFIFGFVVFVGALVTLPKMEIGAPQTSIGEMMGLALAFVVIVGGFSWYYNAELPQRPPPRSQRSGSGSDVPRR